MKIAMLTNNYDTFLKGVPIAVERLCKALRAMGHTVYVFAPKCADENCEEEEKEGIYRFESFPWRIEGAVIPNTFSPEIKNKMKELGVDIIHIHHPLLIGNRAMQLRNQMEIPIVFTYHTICKEYLPYISPECVYLPTGLEEDSFWPEKEEVKQIRQQYASDVDYLFISGQRLTKDKNVSFQLRSMKQVKEQLEEKGKKFRLLLMGEGPERRRLKSLAHSLYLDNEVVFLGGIAKEKRKNYQAAGDLYLFSSKSETQGIALLEAMAVGTPVIALKANAINDIVLNGVNGYVVEEEETSWARTTVDVLTDENKHSRLRIGSVISAREYKEEKIAQTAIFEYEKAMNHFYAKEYTVQIKQSVVY